MRKCKALVTAWIIPILMLLVCNVSPIFAQCLLDKSGWTLYWSEEFNGNSNSTIYTPGKWKSAKMSFFNKDNNEVKVPDPSQLQQFEGYGYFHSEALNFLIANPDAGTSATWPVVRVRSAQVELESDFDDVAQINPYPPDTMKGFMYGMFEIRCKLPHRPSALYPAFWFSPSTIWPPEFDVFEYHAGDADFFSSVHYTTMTGCLDSTCRKHCINHYRAETFNLYDDFHTWTFVWTPDQMTWFLDGRELKTDNDPMHQPSYTLDPADNGTVGNWIMQNKMVMRLGCGPQGPVDTVFDDLIVDYVRVYKPNGYSPGNEFSWSSPNWTGIKDWYFNHLVPLYQSTPYKSSVDWVYNVINDSIPATPPATKKTMYRAVSGLTGHQGGGKYTYIGPFSELWYSQWTPSGFSHQRVAPGLVSGNVVMTDNGATTYFRRNSGIFKETGSIISQVPGISDAVGQILPAESGDDLYYIASGSPNPANKIAFYGFVIPYASPQSLSLASDARSEIVADPNNFNTAYYVSTSNNIKQIKRTSPSGSSFAVSNVTSSNDVVGSLAISPDGNEIFYKGTGNVLSHVSRPSSTSAWGTASPFQVNNGGSGLMNVSNVRGDILYSQDPGNPEWFYVGTDSRPWIVYFNGSGYSASWLSWTANNVLSDFKWIKYGQAPNTIHISYIDVNNKIRTIEWSSCEVLNPLCESSVALKPGRTMNGGRNLQAHDPTKNWQDLQTLQPEMASTLPLSANSSPYSASVQSFSIYPNPSAGVFTIDSRTDISSIYRIDVTSVTGQKIITLTPARNGKASIDLSSFAKGAYYIRITSRNGVETHKVVVE